MRILIDTNVILDVLCDRKEFVSSALTVFNACEKGMIEGYISALSIPNIVYIMRKQLTPAKTREILDSLKKIFLISDLKESDLFDAVQLGFDDYEDALQSICAKRIEADFILTRNVKDFLESPVKAIAPSDFLGLF